MGLSDGGVKMPKKSRLSPMWKRTISHIFTKPATAKYPFVKPQLPEDSRGEAVYQIKACNVICLAGKNDSDLTLDINPIVKTSCKVCFRDCPANAIEIVEVDGKKRPQINLSKCIFCHQCVESCPRHAITSGDLYELATTSKSSLIKVPQPNAKKAESQ
jgi:formate hydrogenlyase subunit 6/NADH:ubiquinone oxidoreductase subunit I